MKKTILSALFILLIGTLFSGAAYSVDESKSDSDKKIPVIGQEETYKIGSGDILEIMTWKEPDFTREVIVRIDGNF